MQGAGRGREVGGERVREKKTSNNTGVCQEKKYENQGHSTLYISSKSPRYPDTILALGWIRNGGNHSCKGESCY